MPLSRVTECFDLATTRFDVVILDEASQSDPLGLLAFALGRAVVVVGDHEQVSPYAVGQSTDRVSALIDEILTDVPNQLCYGGEIRALREETSSRVAPHLVSHRVKNGKMSNGVNRNEALEVASLVSAVCKLEEYEGCTIGIICMVGTEQAIYIDSVLKKRLTISEYQQRRILCGNASQFQGDERDIIFLSIVNSPSDGPLYMRQRDDARKVFNVAASRARDQLWVVHSLNPTRDLKAGDLRLRLISHAEDPSTLRPEVDRERKTFRSELEKEVCLGLREAGYRITQQYMVGECMIDLVVEGDHGKRIAVQCDGDREQTMDGVEEEMARNQMLRRLGWEFIRVRGSEFFRSRDKAMKKLQKRLQEVGIVPVDSDTDATPVTAVKQDGDPLPRRVIKRAELIRSRWKDIPTPSAVRKAAAGERGVTTSTLQHAPRERLE
jgi:very-short-patch-repair endonuclease